MLKKLLRIVDNPRLRRDAETNAVLDVDTEKYKGYLKVKQSKKEQQERIDTMETRINTMEANIADIKTMLIRLLEK